MVESKVKIEDDETLIAKAQEGDLYSFDLLVRKYQKKIYTLAYRIMKNHDAADDIAQETFINAYSSIRSFKLGYSFYTWLYRICMNLSINHLKRQRFVISESQFKEEASPLEKETANEDPLALLVQKEQERKIEEIAKTLRISLGTVMSRLFRARERLQELLKDVILDK
ncbi:MAG: hypothetical protein AMJ73_10045 [candidate division Zixibacteria bacterium SM1_73]|nr:MAG: hypothetical protein AMJ73_10045 [candidate division Zixibacteria bacterium SM1_73]